MPNKPAYREGVRIVDYEAIRALPGYEASRALEVSDEELAADPQAISNALGWHAVPIPLREVLGFSWDQELPSMLQKLETGFGFGLADVDLALTGGVLPPRTLHAIGGTFDPDAIEARLDQCAACLPGTALEHAGQRYWSWGDGQTLSQRNLPPAVDSLGRGGHFVFAEDYVVRSNFLEEFEASIDAEQGRGSLLGDDNFTLLADELDQHDLVALFVSDQSFGPAYQAELLDQVRGNEFLEPRVTAAWDVPNDELLDEYEAFAVGTGVADDEVFTLVLLVHEGTEAAAANVHQFEGRIATGVTAREGLTWAEALSSSEVRSEGRLLIAVLWGDSYFAGLVGTPALIGFEGLLAHR